MLYRYQNIVLQFVVVVCLGVIGGLIYHNYMTIVEGDETLTKKIDDIDVSCPKCPDLKNPISKEDLEFHLKEKDNDEEDHHDAPLPSQCPSAEEISQVIFPGRHAGITQAGRYFDIKTNDSYELLPEYSFFKPEDAFPDYKILDRPLRDANVDVSEDHIDNSLDGEHVNTQRHSSLTRSGKHDRDLEARMARGTGMSNKDKLNKVMKAVASKDPGKDRGASSRLADSVQKQETQDETYRRKELEEKIGD